MKLFPSLLAIAVALGTAPVRAGDGYQCEASAAKEVVALVKTIKVGEVVKVRRVNMDFDRLEENSYTAVFFSHKRDFAPENQFTVNVTDSKNFSSKPAQWSIYAAQPAAGSISARRFRGMPRAY